MQPISLKDIASEVGVSLRTVSRALNSPDSVAPKTRERILTACEAAGYVPNLLARSLVSRRTNLVAALVPPFADTTFHHTLTALQAGLAAQGLSLLVGHGGGPSREASAIDTLIGQQPEALVLTGVTHQPAVIRRLTARRVRTVEIWNLTETPIDVVVGFSNRNAARALTEAVIRAGRRNIAFVGRPSSLSDRARDRQRGYLDALAAAGRQADRRLVVEDEGGFEVGAAAMARLFATGVRFDAVVCTGEALAAGALLDVLARRMTVPDDLLFAVFGGLPPHLSDLGLLAVRIDAAAIGARTAQVIGEMLRGVEPTERVYDVGFELVGTS